MSVEKVILNEFNVMCSEEPKTIYLGLIDYGYILDFIPTVTQAKILKENSRVLDIRTLFSREEYNNSSPIELLTKQILHYIEVYGLGMPGLFDLEVDNGKIVSLRIVNGATDSEIQDRVNALIYRNAPIKNVENIKTILKVYSDYDFTKIANNDVRVDLFDVTKNVFTNGDDAVRWIVKTCSTSDLLIKSEQVVAEIKANAAKIPDYFLTKHENVLSQVFNRHKRIIMALKNRGNRNAINRISRFAKTNHQPLHQSIAKTFISRALNDPKFDFSVLSRISIRDKFKFLNVIAWKKVGEDIDAFIIRNGKIFTKEGRAVTDIHRLNVIEMNILESLAIDLIGLKSKKILLDEFVDYGLPISAKQTLGRLPYGTKVKVEEGDISAGIYWRDEWGARDLDLSAIDKNGQRTGWGGWYGYDNRTEPHFSGDITSAYDGAMEFMTSKTAQYGLFVNTYSGNDECEADIVVGPNGNAKKHWIDTPYIQERVKFLSKGSILGFVNGKEYVVYSGRLTNNRISGKNPVTLRGLSEFWTMRKLFDVLEISYDVTKKELDYDIDLSYSSFTFDKLEKLISVAG